MSAAVGAFLALLGAAACYPLNRHFRKLTVRHLMLAVTAGFFLRLLLICVGLAYVLSKKMGILPFVAGFFIPYFALQWLELRKGDKRCTAGRSSDF